MTALALAAWAGPAHTERAGIWTGSRQKYNVFISQRPRRDIESALEYAPNITILMGGRHPMDDPNLQTGSLPVRDAALALEQTGGDAALAEELFSALLDGLPDELAQLAMCHHESDWVGLAEYAHQIRGATRYCGVPALDAAVATLERTARLGDSVLIEDGMTGVTTEVDRLFTIARPHPGAT